MANIKADVICLGECIMDILPKENKIGGAALNVAIHLNRYGIASHFISAMGEDDYGEEISDFMKKEGLRSTIAISKSAPTGTARVQFKNGENAFEIDPKAAWKNLSPEFEQLEVESSKAVYFGSLCMFFPENQKILTNLKSRLPDAEFFCDVNLRPPYYHKESLEFCLNHCSILKINEQELLILCSYFSQFSNNKSNMVNILKIFNLENIICTMGSKGSLALDKNGDFIETPAAGINPSKDGISDTIGAGDAFSAAYMYGLSLKQPLSKTMENCARFAARICGVRGAIPESTFGPRSVIR